MESCSVVLGPLKLLCAAAPEASAAAAPGGASVATLGLLALLLLSPVLYLTLNTLLPTLLGTQAHHAGTPSHPESKAAPLGLSLNPSPSPSPCLSLTGPQEEVRRELGSRHRLEQRHWQGARAPA